jgi:CRISPR-associated protein Csm1
MEESVLITALAGLLHDVGKFTRPRDKWGDYLHPEASAIFIEEYVPSYLREKIVNAVKHHREPHLETGIETLTKILWIADGWAASERKNDVVAGQSDIAFVPLIPAMSRVELLHEFSGQDWHYKFSSLGLEREKIFPERLGTDDPLMGIDHYVELWEKEMRPELDNWKKSNSWDNISLQAYFVTLLALFRKHFSFLPSASPDITDDDDNVLPDVSLYDHLKTTAAISACLRLGFDDEKIIKIDRAYDQPVAVLVRGDITGIQKFIYRITRPSGESDFGKVAKRLRGRSFYLGLLGDVVVDWLMRELGVTPANVMFSGGGRFDILAPINCQEKVNACEKQLNAWLLQNFYGELGILVETADVKPEHFGDMSAVYEAVELKLGERKQQKWLEHFQDLDFFSPAYKKYHACNVCRTTPLEESGVCGLCAEHEKVGKALPHVTHMAFINGNYQKPPDLKDCVDVFFASPFNTTVLLLRPNEEKNVNEVAWFISHAPKETVTIYQLNETGSGLNPLVAPNAQPNLGQSFRFLANTAPKAIDALDKPDVEELVEAGDVLHFDAIARLSDGAHRIGILKADVDRLGLIFGLGLQPPSISRVSSLSNAIDLFFSGWLNRICERVFMKWENKQATRAQEGKPVSPLYGRVDGLFYVMYSGGDDLFIIGPWDETLMLAKRLNDNFAAYICHNPNITLSAGYIQVKPHYPVQRFAAIVDEAEKQAKNSGRNAIHAFGETVTWVDDEASFEKLMELAEKLRSDVENHNVPRTLVQDLGNLKRQKDKRIPDEKPLFTPHLYYTFTRRLRKEVSEQYLDNNLITQLRHIMIPVSYVSLSTRKE